MKVTAIILAAGNGSRMKSNIKKQYMMLNGKPVMVHAIKAFEKSSVDDIVVVSSPGEEAVCEKIIKDYSINKVKCVVAGGKERYDSVFNGLKQCLDSEYVLIHDGARPLIDIDTIERCISETVKEKACIVAVPVKDTIKIIGEDGKVDYTPQRDKVWSVQTPQAFETDIICEAYNKMMSDENKSGITDDAMVVEKYTTWKISIVEGEYTNIKVTTKDDILVAEKFFEKN